MSFSRVLSRTSTLSNPSQWLLDMFSPATSAGVSVTPISAMQHTAVWGCINILSQSIAVLPLSLYKRETKNKRLVSSKAYNHPLFSLLHDEPNSDMTSFSWRVSAMVHLGVRGNHYSQIIRNNGGKVVGIYPLIPENMKIVRLGSGVLAYLYTSSQYGEVPLSSDEVLHFKGMTLDGIVGMNPIEHNRNTIGLSMAMEEFGGTYFKNGANGGGVLQTDKSLSQDAFDRLKSDWGSKYAGLVNANKPIILEEGLKWEKLAISNEDSQFLQSRKFQKSDIASIYRIPPHMVNEMDKATFGNIEHQSMQFVIDAIMPWVVSMEQEMNRKLLSKSEKANHYIKFNLAALLRGDTTTRYTAYGAGIKDGWMTRNEAREMEDMNPLDGLDDPLYPLNMTKEGNTNATTTK